jgi:hypothetical protein
MNRRLQWFGLFVSFGLGVAGILVFIGGLVFELV